MNTQALPVKAIFAILDKTVEEYQQKIQAKIEAVEELKRKLSGEQTTTIQPNRYTTMSKREAIADVLRQRGEPATVEVIGLALQAGGMDLGERRLRDVRTTITMNESNFFWNGDLANLREWKSRAA